MPQKIQTLLKPNEWQEVRNLVDECLQRSLEERQALLEKATAEKPWLREQVESMLAVHRDDDSVFDAPLVSLPTVTATAPTLPAEEPRAFAPEKLGKYILLHKLGQGGMAEVFLAALHGPGTFEKLVAVKRVHAQYQNNREFRSLFEYEAQLGGRLTHSNIVQVYDFSSIDGVYLLAMEYVSGLDLARIARRLRERGLALPLECALYIVGEICRGLHYAHTRTDESSGAPLHIIHRDVSPRNVMVSFESGIKIVDFGIAKARDRISRTMTGTLRGTLQYLSPEVAAGGSADQRSDLFTVAVILYELIAGRHLFHSENFLSVLSQIKECDISEAQLAKLKVPDTVAQTLLTGLRRKPEDRFQTALEFVSALETCLAGIAPVESARQTLSTLLQREFADEIDARKRSIAHARKFASARGKFSKRLAVTMSVLVLVSGGIGAIWLKGKSHPVAEMGKVEKVGSSVSSETQCLTTIRSVPSGAVVSLNGISVGRTPATTALRCGVRIDVTLEYPGYEPFRQPIRVKSDRAELVLNLTPKSASQLPEGPVTETPKN